MAEQRRRYTVVFRDRMVPHAAARAILSRSKQNPLALRTFDLHRDIAEVVGDVHFSEIGVSYLDLSDEEVRALTADRNISSLHPIHEIRNGGWPITAQAEPFAAALPLPAEGQADAGLPWNVAMVRADQVWSDTKGRGVKVAVLDNGINRHRPDLVVAGGVSFVPDIVDWDDDDGHGTHCAGIIAANAPEQGVIGVAPECALYAVKVMTKGSGNTDWLVAGMMWAAQNKMDVASMSLWQTAGAASPDEAPWEDVQRAAQFLTDAGCLVVGIAGNSGSMINHWVTNPGRCPAVMAVGAVDDQGLWWDKSSYGPPELPIAQSVEVAAPGAAIKSTFLGNEFQLYWGTSMACPHVAGAAALCKSIDPTLSAATIRERLRCTAQDRGAAGLDEKYGLGILDCVAAAIRK